ncbi:MAG: adenine phosphoribosyltransferase [Eubacteriales bacterium]
MTLKDKIRDVPNFPENGIIFRDITTLLKDGNAFAEAVDEIKRRILEQDLDFDLIVGPESRGFIVGTPLAYALKKGFIPLRKPGKLPCKTISHSYNLEYGSDSLEIHVDAIKPKEKVIIVDDLMATGGTFLSAVDLVERLGGEVVAIIALIELVDLKGREKLKGYNIITLLQY